MLLPTARLRHDRPVQGTSKARPQPYRLRGLHRPRSHAGQRTLSSSPLVPQFGGPPGPRPFPSITVTAPPTPSAASASKTLPRAPQPGVRPACGDLSLPSPPARPLPRWLPLPFHQHLPPAAGTLPGESSLPARQPVPSLLSLAGHVPRQSDLHAV